MYHAGMGSDFPFIISFLIWRQAGSLSYGVGGYQSTFAASGICVILAVMRRTSRQCAVVWLLFGTFLTAFSLHADQLQMVNGDHYAGRILSLNSNTIVFESDVLGKVTLPREKVASMALGANAATNAPVAPRVVTATNHLVHASTNVSAALRNGTNAATIEQIRQQMLTGTTPEVNQKYNEMLGGLMSGKLSVNDIRDQAKTAIVQINQLKKESPQADPMLDAYLEILQNFVNDAEPAAPAKLTLPAPPAGVLAPATPTASFGTNSHSLQSK
jgi:hypothetical protein